MFNIEDDELLKGLYSFAKKKTESSSEINAPIWKKYPDVSKINPNKINRELIKLYILILKDENNEITITPRSLMKLNCAPINDISWMINQKERIEKIENLLSELENEGLIIEIEKGYNINPVYNM